MSKMNQNKKCFKDWVIIKSKWILHFIQRGTIFEVLEEKKRRVRSLRVINWWKDKHQKNIDE